MQTIGVVGLGTMGAGIVEVFARAGLAVIAVEVDQPALARGRDTLTGSVDRAHAKGKLSEDQRTQLLGRVTFAVGLPALRDADLVIEAVPERLNIKRALFAELDQLCPAHTVLATNTSSLSVTEIAVGTNRPGQVIGMHFFNPAPVMTLVEVIHTMLTDQQVVADVQALSEQLGKVAVTVGDRAGFVANALLFGYLNDAVTMLATGHATRADIDAAMRLGAGLPMGPLTLLDLIGLDTACEILDTLYHRGGRSRRHAAAPLLREHVAAGMLGRKTGQGFYPHQTPAPPSPAQTDPVATVGVVGQLPELAAALQSAGSEVVVVDTDSPAATMRDQLADADLVVVAAVGQPELVSGLFQKLDQVCRPDAVLATSAAGIPVIDCAMATGRPSQVVGLDLHRGVLAEIVHTVHTAPAASERAHAAAAAAGFTAVTCPDRAGRIVDALLLPHLNDAVAMVASGYATAEDIDAAMTRGCGYRHGPVAMLEQLGLDRVRAGLLALYHERLEPELAPAPLLEQLVTAGRSDLSGQ